MSPRRNSAGRRAISDGSTDGGQRVVADAVWRRVDGGLAAAGDLSDDFTDEVGFTVVQRLGGMGVKVGGGPSAAWHRVESPAVLRHEMAQAVTRKQGRSGH